MDKALHGPGGLLQSHRSLPCNNDDWLRMAAVPVGVKDASFRHMKGVRTWDDGGGLAAEEGCCSGAGAVDVGLKCTSLPGWWSAAEVPFGGR